MFVKFMNNELKATALLTITRENVFSRTMIVRSYCKLQ